MKPYASYKPSGVAWLGDVPSHWASKRLKHIGQFRAGAGFPIEEQGQPDNPLPFFKVKDIDGSNQGGVITTADSTVSIETANRLGAKIFPKNSIVFAKVGAALLLNRFRLLGVDACVDNNMMGYMINADEAFSEFMYWAMQRINFSEIVNPGTVPSLNEPLISNLFMAIPPPDEQQAIADYLDTETARIDTLVQEKEELIGLLREAKLSTVSSILLGGLVGEIKKPSNTKWLGDVPASWVVCRVKHAVMRIEQGWSPECENRLCAPGEWGVLKAGACNHGRFNQAEHKFLPATLNPIPEYEVFAGDVLMSRASGSADLVGSVAFVDEVQPHLMLSDKLFRLVPEEHVDGRYLAWALNTDAQRRQILNCVRGAEGLARNITTTDIKQLWIALPTLDEQKQLAVEANKVASGFDALITHTQEEIALLKELRAATIADAVLGRVDVRSLTQKQ